MPSRTVQASVCIQTHMNVTQYSGTLFECRRASLAQRPAGFQALYSQPQARAAASSDRTHSTSSSGEGGTAQQAQAPVASGLLHA